jgi:hypothetical protein
MAPPRHQISASGRRTATQPGMVGQLYRELRSPENAALVKSVAIFAVCHPRSKQMEEKEKETGVGLSGCWTEQRGEKGHGLWRGREHRLMRNRSQ